MVYFRDVMRGGKKYLSVSKKKNGEEILLEIFRPFAREFWGATVVSYRVADWTPECEYQDQTMRTLVSGFLHKPSFEILPSLGRRILDANAPLIKTLLFSGEFRFITGYWEWAEDILSLSKSILEKGLIYDAVYASLFTYDRCTNAMQAFCEAWCPMVNTLLTSIGELTITLWDLNVIGGLPIIGDAYDESIPSSFDLLNADADRPFQLCKYLFDAYHHLFPTVGDKRALRVPVWVKFWFKKASKYVMPPQRTEKKRSSRAKATYNPSGAIPKFSGWSNSMKVPFHALKVPAEYEEEIYLAAFLSCWLCAFVLPHEGPRIIRPETFKVACMMACGRKICLAVPVLASIYHGLNQISNAPFPDKVRTCFPVHYVYGWLATYFDTHFKNDIQSTTPLMISYSGEGGARSLEKTRARRKIFQGDVSAWICSTHRRIKDHAFFDDENSSETDLAFFRCLRSNFLVLRYQDRCIAELYTPHRFSRQFGYFQAYAPGWPERRDRRVSLSSGFQLWQQFAHGMSRAGAVFPTPPTIPAKFYSLQYKEWWGQVHGSFLENHVSDLIRIYDLAIGDVIAPSDPATPLSKKNKKVPDIEAKSLPQKKAKLAAPRAEVLIKDAEKETPPAKASENQVLEKQSNDDRNWKHLQRKPHPGPLRIHPILDDASSSNHVSSSSSSEGETDDHDTVAGLMAKGAPSNCKEVPTNEIPKSPHVKPAVSVFQGENYFFTLYKRFLIETWGGIQKKLENATVENVSSLREDVQSCVILMEKDGIDLSVLKTRVKDFFERAQAFDQKCSTIADRVPMEKQSRELAMSQAFCADIEAKRSQNQVALLDDEKSLNEIKKKIALLEAEAKEIEVLISQRHAEASDLDAALTKAKEESSRILKTIKASDEGQLALSTQKKELEALKDDLVSFKLFLG
ncbi:unnamed protein product [Cuscuta epithymum]|uniref:Aminotransferase-like plant mobile domain-containing protein n=1 Tax=Cuscuta epithymum TaxID=186058 RepID=A0AAV0C2L8_9ASTE|nr:unnamed protein product [Cuscuta epithymum]